jgi:predicted nucleic acid-binding protein
LFQEAKAKGRILSQVDLILAALARMGKVTILTTHEDFSVFPGISVKNWLK